MAILLMELTYPYATIIGFYIEGIYHERKVLFKLHKVKSNG